MIYTEKSMRYHGMYGQIALSLTFLMGGIIILVAATLAFIAISLLNSSVGFQYSTSAYTVVAGGVQDALLQLARNKDFSHAGYCIPEASLPCGSGSAKVTVTQNSPSAGKATIISEATVSRYTRKIEAVVSIATSTGKSILTSWSLLTF